jgi:hypothetical protein
MAKGAQLASKKHRQGFLSSFQLEERYLLRPDPKSGRPGIYAGRSPDGDQVLVKVWRRTRGEDDLDLREIWQHELRQLHRLAGYPGAIETIAQLRDAGYDENGFYLVLATGQRRPLGSLLHDLSAGHWLKQPKQQANRAKIWANLSLLARGIETLHAQGLLHRNIDQWAVLTAATYEPDFQLTGFEWSMRLAGPPLKHTKKLERHIDRAEDSFLRDWMMFAALSAQLLGADLKRFGDLKIPPHEVAEHLVSREVVLLRELAQLLPMFPVDGEIVVVRISEIVRALALGSASKIPRLHVAFRLGRDSPLADRIYDASDKHIEHDETELQLGFIKADLSDAPMLVAIQPSDAIDGVRLTLRGRTLTYRLQEFRPPRGGTPTWDFGYCEKTEWSPPAPSNVIAARVLDGATLELLPLADAYNRYSRMRGKITSWNSLISELESDTSVADQEAIVLKALSLLLTIETLQAAANVFPVEIIRTGDQISGECILKVRVRADSDRDDLAQALGLKPAGERLTTTLTDERLKPDGWVLSESGTLGERSSSDTEWTFGEIEESTAAPRAYAFTGENPAPFLRQAFLIPPGAAGEGSQFRRRLRALGALREHRELLRMISDPTRRVLESHETYGEDVAFHKLDASKQQALRDIVSTLPLFLVQGPPGVGKTRLVRDLVRRRFSEEPTSRLLLTAQSNAAVDHLLDELESVLDEDGQHLPLVIRCRRGEESEDVSDFDIRVQSRNLIREFGSSEIVSELPEKLRKTIRELVEAASDEQSRPSAGNMSRGRSSQLEVRAFEGTVARAANVVFATTNSFELERLIEERGQFDWAIVEEAGKATGSELVAPLLLSHRRLMIGDHKQLPPFGSEQLIELLKSPEAVSRALVLGQEFIGSSLRDSTTEDLLDDIDSEGEDIASSSAIPRICAEALRLITYFENAIESEFKRQKAKPSARPIAKRLNQQHRMHPFIAQVISNCFYESELSTHIECAQRLVEANRPYTSVNMSTLPLSPIVVINMPYIQATVRGQHGDKYPRWHNPAEVAAATTVVKLLRPHADAPKQPSLAVLSPYSQQVRRLAAHLEDCRELRQFAPPTSDNVYCHTVDSFQGGEADVTIVSLVRNNAHANPLSALGFLTDVRRMNVLLSRARWQLILIASLQFINEVVTAAKSPEAAARVAFLRKLLMELRSGVESRSVSIIDIT